MLSKDALEVVLDLGPGFYSRLFLVEKVMGGWRPVIDLSHLNKFDLQTPFKMETVASVLLSVRKGDFLASIDLKDLYFQIPVPQSSRKTARPGPALTLSLPQDSDKREARSCTLADCKLPQYDR